MRVVVYGLWHLGCVTAACLADAAAGGDAHDVVGLDPDGSLIDRLNRDQPPVQEPGLTELLAKARASGRLTFSHDAALALAGADVLWVTFDTPVDENDRADVPFVRERLEWVKEAVRPGTLVLISSQVPVGFANGLAADWADRDLRFGCSPENLRIGRAIDAFRSPGRVVVGLSHPERDRETVRTLFAPIGTPAVEWMSIASAEMSKHALNALLATNVTFANELARLCESVGANAKDVERALRSEPRVGPKAYVAPGAAFTGGTLARDLRCLTDFGRRLSVETPLLAGVLASNERHAAWARERIAALLADVSEQPPVVTVLGLAYMPGTNRLGRSAGVELARWLIGQGVHVRAHDPAFDATPAELAGVEWSNSPRDAIRGADLAVIATAWPAFRELTADDFAGAMRRARVIDESWFLAGALANDARVVYVPTGRSNKAT